MAFIAVVVLAALPMGGNRDWAWAPMSVALGGLAILVAAGLGTRHGFTVVEAERKPLLGLIVLFEIVVLVALLQMATLAPTTDSAWYYDTAARLLGRAHKPVPALSIDAARNGLIKIVTCGAIFVMARALLADRFRARLFLMAFVASAILVVVYGILAQVTSHSCYLGSYLKKEGDYNLGDRCLMSGTFVNSNSFACYVGMGLVAAMALIFAARPRRASQPYAYGQTEDEGVLASLTGFRLVLVAVCLFLLGAILISGSRAGFAATAAGAVALGALVMRGRWQERRHLAVVLVIGVILAVAVGALAGGALIAKSMGSGDGTDRLRIWQAAFQAVRISPWLGWGLGSFPDIYAVVQPPEIVQPNNLAHSTPIETIVELGIPAGLVAIAMVVLPWLVALRGALYRRRRRYLPAAGFAVAGVAILHSTVDFSLQMPAIGYVVSALLGLGWARSFERG